MSAASRPAVTRLGGVDVQQQGAQPADARPDRVGRRADLLGQTVLTQRRGALRRAGNGEGSCGKVLDHAIVQGPGYPATLLGRRLDRTLQQSLTLDLRSLETVQQPPQDRHQQHDQEQQAGEGHSRKAPPELPGAGRDLGVGPISLKEQRFARRGPDGSVDLKQFAVALLETVLRSRQVRPVRPDHGIGQDVPLLHAQRETLADQSRRIGVEDQPRGVPDLHANNRGPQDVFTDRLVHGSHSLGTTGEEPLGQGGLRDGISQQVRGLGRNGHRLGLGQAPGRDPPPPRGRPWPGQPARRQ